MEHSRESRLVELGLKVSTTKPSGGIYLQRCASRSPSANSSQWPLAFPPGRDDQWNSCYDAYHETWMADVDNELIALSASNRRKLAITMGFCPHMRCQLGSLSHSSINGQCPDGLCFTKLEDGARSFGACCYSSEGVFHSGNLLGFANKSQAVPKPIYKHSRVVLSGATSLYESFVNANYVAQQLIVTQCPMSASLFDVQRMIRQENIRMWIQIAPKWLEEERRGRYKDCYLLSQMFETFSNDTESNSTATSVVHRRELNAAVMLRGTESEMRDRDERHLLQFIWWSDWDDFDVPHPSNRHLLQRVVDDAVALLRQDPHARVAISCLSGRGRSGTVAASISHQLSSTVTFSSSSSSATSSLASSIYYSRTQQWSRLVDTIVSLRNERDGMVEVPRQFRLVAQLSGMPDPSAPNSPHSFFTPELRQASLQSLLTMSLVALCSALWVLFIQRRSRKATEKISTQ